METKKEFRICIIAIDQKNNNEVMKHAEHGFSLLTKELTRKEACALLEKAFWAVEDDNGLQAE